MPDRDQILKYISEGNTKKAIQLLLKTGKSKAILISAQFEYGRRDFFDLKVISVESWVIAKNQRNAEIIALLPARKDKLSKIPREQMDGLLKENKLMEAAQLLQAAGYDEGVLLQGRISTANKLLAEQKLPAGTSHIIYAKIKYELQNFES